MRKLLKATALAIGITLATTTAAIACEQPPPPEPTQQGQLVFIFCGKNAIHRNRVDVIFIGSSPRGWVRLGGIGEPAFKDVAGASPSNPIDIRLGKVHGLVEAAVPGWGDVVSRTC